MENIIGIVSDAPKPSAGKDAGFTLIEVIMVIVFLGVALIAAMNMMSSSLTGSVSTEAIMNATNLANEKMERIFADKKTKGYAYVSQNNYQSESNVSGFNDYNRYVTVTDQTNRKKVEVRVTHPDIEDCIIVAFLTNY